MVIYEYRVGKTSLCIRLGGDTEMIDTTARDTTSVALHDGDRESIAHSSLSATVVEEIPNWAKLVPQDRAKIIIVDDEPIIAKVVSKYLRGEGYERVISITDSVKAFDLISQETPDAILLDIMMPEVDGLTILSKVRREHHLRFIPVIILTASTDHDTKTKALELGATDFLAKPVDPNDLIPRLRNALTVKAYQDSLENHSVQLEKQVRERTAQLAASRLDVIRCLARAGEYRDDNTGRHVIRVGRYAGIIARQLGFDEHRVEVIEHAAQLHDLGKIGVPDAVLLHPGKLEPQEFEIIKKHCRQGCQIFEPMLDEEDRILQEHTRKGLQILEDGTSPILTTASRIAMTHHENWDGLGYPLGLSGEDIPIEGRITAVADVYDALGTKRPYKSAFPREKCLEILNEERGKRFDPTVFEAFLAGLEEIICVQIEYADAS